MEDDSDEGARSYLLGLVGGGLWKMTEENKFPPLSEINSLSAMDGRYCPLLN